MQTKEMREAQEILKEMARLIHRLANLLQAMQEVPAPTTLTKIRGEGGEAA